MKSCREVSTVTLQDAPPASLLGRAEIWLHLAMCRHCRAFRRQMALIHRAARVVGTAFDREPSAGFENKILDRLGR